ncbi:MAG TPA: class I SAM-dependent methyltransferase [Acetobacteraceae bacterium]|nr:class I SAM-dependent methyltransferase [Acetobacteraceae bacterium]
MSKSARSKPPAPLVLVAPARLQDFDEAGYLAANPDVAAALAKGHVPSGLEHFRHYGQHEARLMRLTEAEAALPARQRRKMARVEKLLDLSLPHRRRGAKFDFLTDELRAEAHIVETTAVSANPYDENVMALIESVPDGIILDCGAGKRSVYFDNVVNFEIVDYDSTDVIGVGERLPFKADAFDAVISIAVLEHVRDPFRCAAEIARVLKPGGRLLCCVPFLQPEHGYPRHYYNMTRQGLRALFEGRLVIEDHRVVRSTLPIWSLTWFVQSWAQGLPEQARAEFLDLRLGDLMASPASFLDRSWVSQLSPEKTFELASATMLFARKPLADSAR